MNQQQTQTVRTERTFDENGNTIEEVVADAEGEGAETADVHDADVNQENEGDASAAPQPKFRIGDREFATQDEALAYAQSQITTLSTEAQVADAYRQGIRDATAPNGVPATTVTPAAEVPKFNTEELYTNPQEFLAKYARQIKEEAAADISKTLTVKEQSEQIWREFTDRHPSLADFRAETEGFVEQNQAEVRAIIATKGRDAGYDFVATKLKSRFERYGAAVKPQRNLPNTGTASTPNSRGATVTPKTGAKKPLSFAEQIRSLRKGR